MQIAVLSDCHDRLENLEKVLAHIQQAQAVLFCGDFCAPFTLKMLGEGFRGPIHSVLGNNDGDVFLLLAIAKQVGNVSYHQPMARLEMGGKRIAVVHYPEFGEALALCGKYDAVFSGHNHTAEVQTLGGTLWGNPGEVMGRFGQPSFGLYDTDSHTFEIVRV
ncbi:MAG: metallophosphoesterase [Chloroflexi bacterium]|nr:metallophosphoesterase [Chloroflexota bacterium]